MYSVGLGVEANMAKAVLYWSFAAMGGDPQGQMMLGYRYLEGISVEKDCETALVYYKNVAEKGQWWLYSPYLNLFRTDINITESSLFSPPKIAKFYYLKRIR